jgi:hypothetical protein
MPRSSRPGNGTPAGREDQRADRAHIAASPPQRRLFAGDRQRDVELTAGTVNSLPAQQHAGENIGETATHVIFVELKADDRPDPAAGGLGPG